MAVYKTVPNQRVVTVKKEQANKQNLYTINNLMALNYAAGMLESKGGFKLYIYFAKNQNNYNFALSSSDFCAWSGLSQTAYTTAFKELQDKGFLVEDRYKKGKFVFYEMPIQNNNK